MATEVEAAEPSAPPRERHGLELIGVLGITYAASGIGALLENIRDQLLIQQGPGFSHVATGPIVSVPKPTYAWFDITADLVDVLLGLMPAFLAVVLLMRSPAGVGFGIGLDRIRRIEIPQGLGFAALIGIPGLGLVYVARQIGANAQIVATNFPDVWYRIPMLLFNAVQDGVAEEVVVCGYVLVRLGQLGWRGPWPVITAAVLRGSYHLYQGFGGFAGNFVMGLIFGWWFQRTRRVWPLIVAHSVIDAVSFIGYVYLHDKVSWI